MIDLPSLYSIELGGQTFTESPSFEIKGMYYK